MSDLREEFKKALVDYGLAVVRATNDHVIYSSQPRNEVISELEKLADLASESLYNLVDRERPKELVIDPHHQEKSAKQPEVLDATGIETGGKGKVSKR